MHKNLLKKHFITSSLSHSFTLIELLVTLFIITILAAASIPMIRNFQQTSELKTVAYDIKSAILETKNYALAPRNVSVSGQQIWSYAVVFYGPSYSDTSKQNSYEITECQGAADPNDSEDCPTGGTETMISSEKLPKGVVFVSYSSTDPNVFDWDMNNDNRGTIRFSVPEQGKIVNQFRLTGYHSGFAADIAIKRQNDKFIVVVDKIPGTIHVQQI